jgi:hypothetical protein
LLIYERKKKLIASVQQQHGHGAPNHHRHVPHPQLVPTTALPISAQQEPAVSQPTQHPEPAAEQMAQQQPTEINGQQQQQQPGQPPFKRRARWLRRHAARIGNPEVVIDLTSEPISAQSAAAAPEPLQQLMTVNSDSNDVIAADDSNVASTSE